MKNLSWLYYKGYYQGFNDWQNIKSQDVNIKRRISDYFVQKNSAFKDAKLSDFKPVQVPSTVNSFFKLTTTYPGLLMGSGYSHGIGAIGEFKIGFHLDHVTGLPIIPGSSVKGTLRSVFPLLSYNAESDKFSFKGENETERKLEKVKAKWLIALLSGINDPDFKTRYYRPVDEITEEELNHLGKLIFEVFEGVKDNTKIKAEEKYYSIYDRCIFFEAIAIESNHNGLVYGDDSITPHPDPLKNPTPLLFLKVLPKVSYKFHFKLENCCSYPELNSVKLANLFEKILLEIGIGAKTNVGYGQFIPYEQGTH